MNVQSIDDVLIRTASNQDAWRITALVSGVLFEYGLHADPESTDADLKNIEESYIKPSGTFEVIEDRDGNLLGSFGLFPLDEDTCELRKMYFVREIRGIGLGRHVLERAADQARRLGFKRITLETAGVLKEAIRLYTRFGFVPVESDHLSARCDQAYVLDLR